MPSAPCAHMDCARRIVDGQAWVSYSNHRGPAVIASVRRMWGAVVATGGCGSWKTGPGLPQT
eukprot:15368211-Alexandrium_andersonii.AAC.1